MNKWSESQFIVFCKCISSFYKDVKRYQLLWGIGIIIVVAYAFLDKRFIPSYQIPACSELIQNPIIFLWSIILVGVISLFLNLVSIKPFTVPIDYFLLLIPVSFLIYAVIAYLTGGFVGFKLIHLVTTLLVFSGLLLLRVVIIKIKVAYFNKLKEACINNTTIDIFKADVPIKLGSQDELDRKEFSEAIGEAIISYQATNSLALGVTGEWGSGKSSIINMSIEYINNYYKDKPIKPCIVEFNPWNFSDQNQLIEQFFRTLSDAIKGSNAYLGSKNISEKLDIYSSLIGQVLTSTALNTPVVGFSSLIKNLGGLIVNNQANSIKGIRSQLDEAIGEYPGKIIVIVDDIDRLTNIEMRQVFQLVKSIANFANTVYILSFDKQVVINGLCPEQGTGQRIDGEKYLEKIIQVDLDIPAIKLEKIYLKLNESLKILLNNSKIDEIRWMNIWYDGLKDFFSNIRDVNRYMNTLRFRYGMIRNQVNNIDLIAIIAIKVFDYTTYCFIQNNINLLAGILNEDSQQEKEQIRTTIDSVVAQSKYNILPLLKRLFPKLDEVYENKGYSASFLTGWFAENRICHPERFRLYFQLDISDGDISPLEIEKILLVLDDERLFRKHIKDLINDKRILRFLEVFENYTTLENKVPTSSIENIITVLLDEGDAYPNSNRSDLLSTELTIARITYQLCQRYSNQRERGILFLTIANNVNNSLYPFIYDIYLYDQEHGRYGLKENPVPEEHRTFSSQDLDLLEKAGLSKIREWSKSQRLEEHIQLKMIMYIWGAWAGSWGDKDEVKRYLDEKMKKDDFLIKFIGLFINTVRRQTVGNYAYNEIEYYELEGLKKILNDDLDVICECIEKINRDMLTEEQRKTLNMFIDALNGKNLSPWDKMKIK